MLFLLSFSSHPLVSYFSSQVGDNTNLVVILCGELLQQASTLIFQGLKTSDIIHGYNKAADKALEILEGECMTEKW